VPAGRNSKPNTNADTAADIFTEYLQKHQL
jgi:hypothetical protein